MSIVFQYKSIIKNEASDSGNGGADYCSASKPDKLASVRYSIALYLLWSQCCRNNYAINFDVARVVQSVVFVV